MKIEGETSINPLYTFLAGALLPTIAFLLQHRSNKESEKFVEFVDENDDYGEESSSEGDDGNNDDMFQPIDDPKKWGFADAPYKVSFSSCIYIYTGGWFNIQCCVKYTERQL